MQVIENFQDVKQLYNGCVIALGTFDGIHLGHKDIVSCAKEYAKEHKIKSVVFSFSNHPLDFIAPEKAPLRICSEQTKKHLLNELGIDLLFNMHFDYNFAKVSSEEFIANLKTFFNPSCLVIGDNYSYGYLGAGTAQTLVDDGKKHGFEVVVRSLVKLDDIIVSSTNIRKYITKGDVQITNRLLGHRYCIDGKVIHGFNRGAKMGFATANVETDCKSQIILGDGVYLAKVNIDNKQLNAIVNIGKNPTFALEKRQIEVHILDFSENIYGKAINVSFIKKIRDEQKFNNEQELIKTVTNDIKTAKDFFGNTSL